MSAGFSGSESRHRCLITGTVGEGVLFVGEPGLGWWRRWAEAHRVTERGGTGTRRRRHGHAHGIAAAAREELPQLGGIAFMSSAHEGPASEDLRRGGGEKCAE